MNCKRVGKPYHTYDNFSCQLFSDRILFLGASLIKNFTKKCNYHRLIRVCPASVKGRGRCLFLRKPSLFDIYIMNVGVVLYKKSNKNVPPTCNTFQIVSMFIR